MIRFSSDTKKKKTNLKKIQEKSRWEGTPRDSLWCMQKRKTHKACYHIKKTSKNCPQLEEKMGPKKGLKLRFEFFMNFYSNFFPIFRCRECARGALEAHTQKNDKIRGRVEDSFLLNKWVREMIQARLTDSFFLRRKEAPGDSEPHFQENCVHPPHFYERACAPLGN